jgi:hypothetical protein
MKLKLYVPKRTNVGYKKFEVLVKSPTGNIKKIYFGDKRYEDYTQHGDKKRKASFRARHRCDPVKQLNRNTPRYWACQYLWNRK